VFRQRQPVRAGHRQVCLLQGPEDLFEQRAAPPHQDQHVAGVGGPPAAFAAVDIEVLVVDRIPPLDQRADLERNHLGQFAVGAGLALDVHRRVPRQPVVACLRAPARGRPPGSPCGARRGSPRVLGGLDRRASSRANTESTNRSTCGVDR
jgi:hypothetical protein